LRLGALKKFTDGHLWYLANISTGLAFFDKSLPIEIKGKMIAALDKKPQTEEKSLVTLLKSQKIKTKDIKH